MSDGIERLRARRGSERVTFGEIADHCCDFVDRYPAERDAVERFARFLAAVERIDHNHNADPAHGLTDSPSQRAAHV